MWSFRSWERKCICALERNVHNPPLGRLVNFFIPLLYTLQKILNVVVNTGNMEATVAFIPKVENIFVHTGNIVNWSRLKETVSKSAASEVI